MTEKFTTHDLGKLTLGIPGFEYADLYDPQRLADLLGVFDDSVRKHDPELLAEMTAYRECAGVGMKPEVVSELLVKMAPLVGTFVACLFNVNQVRDQQISHIR
jgi:hypothetical protein